MSKLKSIVLCCLTFFILTAIGSAATNQQLADENAKLRQRLERLEGELNEIKDLLKGRETAPPKPAEPVTVPSLSDDDLKKITEMVKEENKKSGVWADLDLQFYGYIKADASYDNSRVNPGNFVLWVDSEDSRKNDNEFNMTARQTRLGFHLKGPKDGELVTSGRAEIDFYGESGARAENRAGVMLRHAFLKLDWPEDRFSIIAGQTSDVISPLNPFTLNYSVAWFAGNIGYRHPQIRLTKSFELNEDVGLELQGSISRTIGDDFDNSGALDVSSESGEDAGFPTLMGRAALTFPFIEDRPTTLGFSGHWGREELDLNNAGTSNKKFESWSLNVDLKMALNDWVSFTGEMHTGENLDDYFGGIGQGVNLTTFEEIHATGGWAALEFKPWEKWIFNTGFSMEDVERGDVNQGDRTQNRSAFANMIYSLNKNTDWGVEISQWHTERKGERDANDFRVQTSFVYRF